MYFMSNAKIKIFKQRLLNLDFALTQNEKFYFFFYHQFFSSQLLQYLKKKPVSRSLHITNTVSLVHLEKVFIVLRIT